MAMDAADVAPLFSPADLATPESFLAALQARFINDKLKPESLAPLTDFLKTRFPIQEVDIRKAIRLLMSTPEYQVT